MNARVILDTLAPGMSVNVIKATSRFGSTIPTIEIKNPAAIGARTIGRAEYRKMAAAAHAVAALVHAAAQGYDTFAVDVEILSGERAYVKLELVDDTRDAIDGAIDFLGRVIA
jgi:hypothetical protein